MLLRNSKNQKKGLFLSIETVAVIIIITAIAAVIVSGIAHLFKMYKVYQISRDIAQYSEAVTQFKISFKFLPGDVPSTKLGSGLNNSFLSTDVNNTFFKAALPRGFISKESGTSLAWRELALAKLISFNINLSSVPPVSATTGCATAGVSTLVSGGYIPTATWDDTVAWALVSDQSTNGVVKDALLASTWGSSKPRLILFRHGKLTTATDCLADIAIASKDVGAISPNIAAEVDAKIDDGLPSAVTSNMISENYVANTCTNVGAATGAPLNVLSAAYNSSNDDSGTKGCVIQVGIVTNE